MKKLCVLLPAYNEERAIGTMIEKILHLDIPGMSIVTLVVDDGSRDQTARIWRSGPVFSTGKQGGRSEVFRLLRQIEKNNDDMQ